MGIAFGALYLPDLLAGGQEELPLLPIEGGSAIVMSDTAVSSTGEAKAADEIKKKISELAGQNGETAQAPKSLRDPFSVGFAIKQAENVGEVEAAPVVAAKKTLDLQGIFLAGDKRTAIIDDEMVQEGEWVQGWKVQKIYTNRVVLVKGGREKILYIKIGVD